MNRARVACIVIAIITLVATVALLLAGIWASDHGQQQRLLQTSAVCGALTFIFGAAATYPGWN